MEEAQTKIEGGIMSAFEEAWNIVKWDVHDIPYTEGAECGGCGTKQKKHCKCDFGPAWTTVKSEEKGKFRGYSKNTISGRSERQAKNRAWNQSRRVQRGRTRKRYARNKTRGNVRPSMRRQLGAGGSRKETKR
tara:strand:+ start:224 stop:622 length:399 start_codon:yes stop_codon:yes gene_type:complete